MRKRPSRKRAKRSRPGDAGQLQQKLSKRARELYRPESADDDPDGEWHAGLGEELDAPRRGRRGRAAGRQPEAAAGSGEPAAPGQQGRVVSISSGACRVESAGREIDCVLPSDLARDQQAALAVGDEVVFSVHGDGAHRLSRVLPRRTCLSRPDPRNPRRERVIAANIDVAVHVASVVSPPLRPALIDRYVIAIERSGAEAAVCVNKIDLLGDGEARRRELDRLSPYRQLGLTLLPCSALTGEGLDAVRAHLAGRTAVFTGHSGVGKSSLLNALSPEANTATGRVQQRSGTGRHTTSRSSLYRLADGIRIIDTPGIREFGLWRLSSEELRAYFAEFAEHAGRCRFADCSHSHEPDCAVRAAADGHALAKARYAAYLRILSSLDEDGPMG